ncbi:hypothetical protein AXF42_Ash003154 [Apostasia shenzhenica]|uniref:ACT domain-containing protein ACR n=1 Tax=Apostasia shenzhenica TaxID=1088818 RepID=A0A2I0BFB9_9ASPA|nr:hypothetical protein AXF42_Ash003154 [Apostasia shenzhenica]
MDQGACCPYFDPDFESTLENIAPPRYFNVTIRVCVDNDTWDDCTLVKVDSANRHGILLEMVQVLADLDLFISKSYIASDGGWVMDVFHVTDQLGNKLTDNSLIRFIQQSLDLEGHVGGGHGSCPAEVKTCLGNLVGAGHLNSDYTALEVTAADRPGLLSEVTAVLSQLECDVDSCTAWTHNSRAACILYITDRPSGHPISDPARLVDVQLQIEGVVEAHHSTGELRRVSISGPSPNRIHTERRLHQLMQEDRDYEAGPHPPPVESDQFSMAIAAAEARRWFGSGGANGNGTGWGPLGLASSSSPVNSNYSKAIETQASIEEWKVRDYSVVNVRSRDRPKLFFDTVCTLTDLQYDIFHASVRSQGSLAVQEYYIRHANGSTLDSDVERKRVIRCVVAAIERRVSQGVRVEMRTADRKGLLSDITRAFRENGLSLAMAKCGKQGEMAVGSFYVTDASSSGSGDLDLRRLEAVCDEIGGIFIDRNGRCGGSKRGDCLTTGIFGSSSSHAEERVPRFSLGSLLWSHIERISSSFSSISRS